MASQKAMINTMLFYHWDNTLFNNMSLPTGISRDDVVASILEESSDFPVIITDLETLRFSINKWSAHRVEIWEHLKATTEYTYNPIHNYDRSETELYTVTHTGTGSVKGDGGADTLTYNTEVATSDSTENSGSDVVSLGGSDMTTNSGSDVTSLGGADKTTNSGADVTAINNDITRGRTGSDTTTESVSAFNESGYNDHTQSVQEYDSGDTENTDRDETLTHGHVIDTDYGRTETLAHGHVIDTDYGRTETTAHGLKTDQAGTENKTGTETRTNTHGETETRNFTDSHTRTVTVQGNIGVMSTQEMIQKERDIADFDIIDIITKEYISKFCIMIY